MRSPIPLFFLAALAACDGEDQVVRPTDRPQLATGPSYTVVKLTATLGGTQSRGMAINGSGWIAGWSNRSDGTRHAALWRNGRHHRPADPRGPSSTVPWQGLNDAGLVVGISQTDEADPLDEDWSCELGGSVPSPNPTNLVCRGFAWENRRHARAFPLGGHHSFGTGGTAGADRRLGGDGRARFDLVDKQVLGSGPRSGS